MRKIHSLRLLLASRFRTCVLKHSSENQPLVMLQRALMPHTLILSQVSDNTPSIFPPPCGHLVSSPSRHVEVTTKHQFYQEAKSESFCERNNVRPLMLTPTRSLFSTSIFKKWQKCTFLDSSFLVTVSQDTSRLNCLKEMDSQETQHGTFQIVWQKEHL